jgi:hypothetical protein
MNVAGDDGWLSADRIVNFLPVNILASRCRCRNQASANGKHRNESHHFLLAIL